MNVDSFLYERNVHSGVISVLYSLSRSHLYGCFSARARLKFKIQFYLCCHDYFWNLTESSSKRAKRLRRMLLVERYQYLCGVGYELLGCNGRGQIILDLSLFVYELVAKCFWKELVNEMMPVSYGRVRLRTKNCQ